MEARRSQAMPRTSTAERHHYVCPLCREELARDTDQKGWLRHKSRPDVERLLASEELRGLMTEDDRAYLRSTGLCPFERGQKDTVDEAPPRYSYLEPREGSRYRQYFLKGRGVRAESIYRETVGPDARTAEQVAADFHLPVEAVWEAIEYSEHNEELLRQEREEDWSAIRSWGPREGRLNPSGAGADRS
jgi:hypothetical protein